MKHEVDHRERPFEVCSIIPESDGGLGWDVRVPRASERYDAKTIIRMVKLVNRRGRVRYMEIYDDEWAYFRRNPVPISGLDERLEFVSEALSSNALWISFEDPREARKFLSDLESLRISPDEQSRIEIEMERRRSIALSYARHDYPPALHFTGKAFWSVTGYKWLLMVSPANQEAAVVNSWMRHNMESRYWPAAWRPGEPPTLVKLSWRYWHLKVEQWRSLLDRCKASDEMLIVHFMLQTDYQKFDRQFGPSKFIYGVG